MSKLPTVKIKSEMTASGFLVINQSRFDPEVHELFEETEVETTEAAEPAESGDAGPAEEAEVTYPVATGGGMYELSNGERIRGKADAEKAQAELDKE